MQGGMPSSSVGKSLKQGGWTSEERTNNLDSEIVLKLNF